jgi:hypothetical protein
MGPKSDLDFAIKTVRNLGRTALHCFCSKMVSYFCESILKQEHEPQVIVAVVWDKKCGSCKIILFFKLWVISGVVLSL